MKTLSDYLKRDSFIRAAPPPGARRRADLPGRIAGLEPFDLPGLVEHVDFEGFVEPVDLVVRQFALRLLVHGVLAGTRPERFHSIRMPVNGRPCSARNHASNASRSAKPSARANASISGVVR